MDKSIEQSVQDMLETNYKKYVRMAYSYVHNEADALDVVQESAYKAIYFSDKLKHREFVDAWICRIVINEAITCLRKKKHEFVELSDYEGSSEDQYEDLDLRTALEKLPWKDKTVIVLHYFEDMSLEQVAHALEENLSTIKSRMYRALGKLKLSMKE